MILKYFILGLNEQLTSRHLQLISMFVERCLVYCNS